MSTENKKLNIQFETQKSKVSVQWNDMDSLVELLASVNTVKEMLEKMKNGYAEKKVLNG